MKIENQIVENRMLRAMLKSLQARPNRKWDIEPRKPVFAQNNARELPGTRHSGLARIRV